MRTHSIMVETPEYTPGHRYREELICQAAYFRAQQRQRTSVEYVEDWLDAECAIDGMLTFRPRRP